MTTQRKWETGFYYRIRVLITDQSTLHASEYKDIQDRSYSFHWQDSEGQLIVRWDNAPHYRDMSTFPHHVHFLDRVEECLEMTFEEALDYIEAILKDQ